jgi:heat shock protein HspQ
MAFLALASLYAKNACKKTSWAAQAVPPRDCDRAMAKEVANARDKPTVGPVLTVCFPHIQVQSMDKRPGAALAKSQGLKKMIKTQAKYNLGQVVRHKKHPFRGVVFDIDAEFSNSEEWYDAIPEGARPRKGQPFYHLLAENDHTYYVAYVSEQNLIPDDTGEPVDHPDVGDLFGEFSEGRYPLEYQLN